MWSPEGRDSSTEDGGKESILSNLVQDGYVGDAQHSTFSQRGGESPGQAGKHGVTKREPSNHN